MRGRSKKTDKETGAPSEAGWRYNPEKDQGQPFASAGDAVGPSADKDESGAVQWSASEFVDHEKGPGWYAILIAVAILISGGIYLATRDVFSTAAVIIMVLILGVAGSRKPRVVDYRLDSSGLTIGTKHYPYSQYKSFALPDDGPFVSILLTPMRRFGMPVGGFLAPDIQKKALDILSRHLPIERGEPGLVDTLMRRLRF